MDYLLPFLAIFASVGITISVYLFKNHLEKTQLKMIEEYQQYKDSLIPVEIEAHCDFPLELTSVEGGMITIHEPESVIMPGNETEYYSWKFAFYAKPESLLTFEIQNPKCSPNHGFKAEVTMVEGRIITSNNQMKVHKFWRTTNDPNDAAEWIWNTGQPVEETFSSGSKYYNVILYDLRI